MIPTSQSTYTQARFLVMVNDEIRSYIVPLIMRCRENYFSYDIDTDINSTGIYDISTRAMGSKAQNAALINGTERQDLSWISEEELISTDQTPTGKPGVYFKRNQIVLVPPTDHGYGTFRQTIFLRPCEVVAQESAAVITAINTGTKTVTCTTVPSTWTTSNTFELVQANPHFDSLSIDQTITAVVTGSSGTITFTDTLPSRLAVGDWVGLAGQSPIIQLPLEGHALLSQRVANQCLKNSPHTKAYETGVKEAESLEKALTGLISPRMEKEGKKVYSRNGMLRRGM